MGMSPKELVSNLIFDEMAPSLGNIWAATRYADVPYKQPEKSAYLKNNSHPFILLQWT